MDIFPVIMAGGKGERFWPASRATRPKQMLSLFGDKTLIEYTVERQLQLCPPENIFIITNAALKPAMEEILPIPAENIIGEPFGRDTAPCVGLAASLIKAKTSDNAVMLLLPADQVIHDTQTYTSVMKSACEAAISEDAMITVGIRPTYPATGFGYIQCGEHHSDGEKTSISRVDQFKEKPDEATAQKFLDEGNYRWNAGMFVWSVDTIFKALQKNAPQIAEMSDNLTEYVGTAQFAEKLEEEYSKQEKVSIDYALMEKADNILVADGTFDWDDVGSWPALENHLEHDEDDNTVNADVALEESVRNIIYSTDKNHKIALVGCSDMIVVHTDDATLICPKDKAQDVKKIVQQLKDKGSSELL